MHLFNKENIWSNPCSFLHTSSHSDKYNNSVDRIISKEEEREDPRRELQSIFEYSSVSTNTTRSTRSPVFPHAIQQLQLILHTELILSQENYNYKAHPMQIVRRHLPATVPHASKHSTLQNQAPRPLQHKQASSNSTRHFPVL